MPVTFRRCDPGVPPASDLIAAILAEYDVIAGRHLTGGPSATTGDFSPHGPPGRDGGNVADVPVGGVPRGADYNDNPHATVWGEKDL